MAMPTGMDGMSGRVVMVVFDGFQLFDLAGPADVFAAANLLSGGSGYRLEVTAVRAGSILAHNGLATTAQTPLAEVAGPIDTLLVTGGLGVPGQAGNRQMIEGIARLAPAARRIASVCSGAFLLAEAGLLASRRVTTHWLMADEL